LNEEEIYNKVVAGLSDTIRLSEREKGENRVKCWADDETVEPDEYRIDRSGAGGQLQL